MAVPKFFEFFTPVLTALNENGKLKIQELCPYVVKDLMLTKEEMEEMIPSQKKYKYKDRIDWSIQYLKNAGLIERVSHGTYTITKAGKDALLSGKTIDIEYLEQFDSFRQFHSKGSTDENLVVPDSEPSGNDITPQEAIEAAYKAIHDELSKSLLKEIMKAPPEFFEKLVVDLLLAMGYGYDAKAGKVVGQTGDGGIDGIINEDKLGFSQVYVQAKRWNESHRVGRPDVQTFVGALVGKGATKGLFITTGQFTEAALSVPQDTKSIKLVLIDGAQLAHLMITYGVGVSRQTTYMIMQIDNDYFEE